MGWVAADLALPEEGVEVLIELRDYDCRFLVAEQQYSDGEWLWVTQDGWVPDRYVVRWRSITELLGDD